MKRIVYTSIPVICVMIAAVFFLRDYLGLVFLSYFLEPKHNFFEKVLCSMDMHLAILEDIGEKTIER